MNIQGVIEKMGTRLGENESDTVDYSLKLRGESESIPLNQYLGKKLSLDFRGQLSCLHCEKETQKLFQGGYCFSCFKKLAECDSCIMSPQFCHYHLGTCRDASWGQKNCMVPHYVYLSYTSEIKVGITRHTQIPTRWIDQGATAALTLFKVSSRYQSGLLEVMLKQQFSDKTQWRKMLAGSAPPLEDLESLREDIYTQFEEDLEGHIGEFGEEALIFTEDTPLVRINYPVREYPTKIKSLRLEKVPLVEGTLMGIKGQYLILDCGVFNVRNHTSYHVNITLES